MRLTSAQAGERIPLEKWHLYCKSGIRDTSCCNSHSQKQKEECKWSCTALRPCRKAKKGTVCVAPSRCSVLCLGGCQRQLKRSDQKQELFTVGTLHACDRVPKGSGCSQPQRPSERWYVWSAREPASKNGPLIRATKFALGPASSSNRLRSCKFFCALAGHCHLWWGEAS